MNWYNMCSRSYWFIFRVDHKRHETSFCVGVHGGRCLQELLLVRARALFGLRASNRRVQWGGWAVLISRRACKPWVHELSIDTCWGTSRSRGDDLKNKRHVRGPLQGCVWVLDCRRKDWFRGQFRHVQEILGNGPAKHIPNVLWS